MWIELECAVSIALILLTYGLLCYVAWTDRNAKFNIIKHVYMLAISTASSAVLANTIVWTCSLLGSLLLSQTIVWIRMIACSSLFLMKSLLIGVTFIKIKNKHSWAWTPHLLQTVLFGVVISWLACTIGYVLSILVDPVFYLPDSYVVCREFFCNLNSRRLLVKYRLVVTVVYATVLLLQTIAYLLNYKKLATVDPNLPKDKIACYARNTKMYLLFNVLMSAVVLMESTAQVVLYFHPNPTKSTFRLLSGYVNICQAAEPLVIIGVYFYCNIHGKVPTALMNLRRIP